MAKGKLKEYIKECFVAFIIVLIFYLIFWPTKINGMSMEPTLYEGERIIVSRVLLLIKPIRQGDIVVCKIEFNGKPTNIVKRVVATPGDIVSVINDEIFINDTAKEGFLLKEGQYFIIGDNTAESYDSRNVGAIERQKFIGKVVLRLFPFTLF